MAGCGRCPPSAGERRPHVAQRFVPHTATRDRWSGCPPDRRHRGPRGGAASRGSGSDPGGGPQSPAPRQPHLEHAAVRAGGCAGDRGRVGRRRESLRATVVRGRGPLSATRYLSPPDRPMRRDHRGDRRTAAGGAERAWLPLSAYAAFVRPWRRAYITSPTRSRTPSFWKMLVRWVFTVRSLIVSVAPTSLFLFPDATRRTISSSRSVSPFSSRPPLLPLSGPRCDSSSTRAVVMRGSTQTCPAQPAW